MTKQENVLLRAQSIRGSGTELPVPEREREKVAWAEEKEEEEELDGSDDCSILDPPCHQELHTFFIFKYSNIEIASWNVWKDNNAMREFPIEIWSVTEKKMNISQRIITVPCFSHSELISSEVTVLQLM